MLAMLFPPTVKGKDALVLRRRGAYLPFPQLCGILNVDIAPSTWKYNLP